MAKLSEVIKKYHLLENKSHSKKFGQNFILDLQMLDKIVSFAGEIEGKNILEIGPGAGSLTSRILLHKPKKFVVIEKDPTCAEAIKSWLDVDMIEGDVLKTDFKELLSKLAPVKIIANLPYNISTEILSRLAENVSYIEDMVLMFQKEVAQRIVAKPNTKEYGRLSILTQLCFEPKMVYTLPPSAFIPPPKVDSSVVYFKPKGKIDFDIKKLSGATNILFSKRRKMLRQTFDSDFLLERGIEPTLRPENLKPEDFLKLIQT